MNYKAPLLIILVVVAAFVLYFLIFQHERRTYEIVAQVGSPAPEFEYPDSSGKIWKLSDLRGKVVFINFWATWCVTCKAEMPSKEALYEKMQGKPFQMFGMLFKDDPANLNDYYKIQRVSLPTLISPKNEAGKLYGITGVPETFIIDKEGIIREKIVGPRVWDSPEMVALMEKWL